MNIPKDRLVSPWDDEAPEGVLDPFEGESVTDTSAARLLGLPELGARAKPRALKPSSATANEAVNQVLRKTADALKAAAENGRGWRLRLEGLTDDERALLADALGKGEVAMTIAAGAKDEGDAQIVETVLPGVWMGRAETADGALGAEWIEVADAPFALRYVAAHRPRTDFPFEALSPPRDAMNVMGVLAEIRSRAAAWQAGDQNHVFNFTLFPMTEADTAFLAKVVGEAGVRISSGGYGAARVIMTALSNVWAVQYLNGLGAVILDTIEIGDVPNAVLASTEDFADSAARLLEIQTAYLQ